MLNWEEIKQNHGGTLFRCKVPNGWLVKEVQEVHIDVNDGAPILSNTGYEWTSSLAFVPDVNHEWDTNKEIKSKVNKENVINTLIKSIPNDLVAGYYLDTITNGEHSKKLRDYILDNFNGGELHLLLNEFKLITLNINN